MSKSELYFVSKQVQLYHLQSSHLKKGADAKYCQKSHRNILGRFVFGDTFSTFIEEKIPKFEIYTFQGGHFRKPTTNGNQNNRKQRE